MLGTPTVSFVERRAIMMIRHGFDLVEAGELEEAKREFSQSARLYESAEALTYWGWMEFHLGDTERAIALCRKAIVIDPDFGNPYNDIGSYLVSLGRTDEAIPWFYKAILASRYEPRQFPHINLGKLYLEQKQYRKALTHFQEAQRYAPRDPEIERLVGMLREHLL